ncbi:hypothetical protein F5Y09DRAFT_335198 [Xylaria sp. FL1042]|nr:hypothetical protein F5Y09DRAFT_335198 [Xylaria sp. FL1042]
MRLPRILSHLRPSPSSSSPTSPSTFSSTATRFSKRPATPTQTLRPASTFQSAPSPPRLPASEQAEFERLQRTANTQEGFNATSSPDFSSSSSSSTTTPTPNPPQETSALSQDTQDIDTAQPTPLRKGAPPEFEGDVNPRTGEVGGPKNEPLRWGATGDYSFNGRVTDF